ncbi:MAG: hypothetical protein IPM92_04885 [Saprospiraceae bacterium]|nr:hypothetical protein [Saprospiraceae bacterium]
MNCSKQIIFICLFQLILCNAYGQQIIDSLKVSAVDSIKTVKLSLFSFSAQDPEHLMEIDTQISLLPRLNNWGLALSNAYTIRLENFDQSANSRFYQHGQNSMSNLKAFPENYVFTLPNQAYSEVQTNRWRALSNSQAGFQDNFDISLIFASAFRNNITWNFSYDRQIYKGIYTHEKQRNTLFTTGLNFASKSKSYQTNLVFTTEGHYLEHHWGISSDTFLQISQFSVRESVPVNNLLAFTESSNRNLQSHHLIRLRKDTTLPFSRLQIRSSLGRFESDYTDTDNRPSDSLYFAYNIDSSIRLNIEEDYWTNQLVLNLYSTSKQQIYGNFQYEWQNFKTGSSDRSRTVFKLGAKHHYLIDSKSEVKSELNYWLASNKSYPDLNITGIFKNYKGLSGNLSLYHLQKPIPNVYETIYLNDSIAITSGISHSDFSTSGFRLNVKMESPLKPFLRLEFKRYDQYFYLGRNAMISELNDAKLFEIQAGIESNPGIWQLKLEGQYQKMTPDSLGITGWLLESQFGLATTVFKNKVFAKLGLRCNLAGYANKPAYFPLLQLFQTSGESNQTIYSVGAYAHFTVQDFQFKLDLDQIDSFWEKQRKEFIHRYPIYDFMLRMAISWRFLN